MSMGTDVLVGAFEASKVAVYRARPVVIIEAQVVVPEALNPEEKSCTVSKMEVSCFTIQMCVGVSGKNIPLKMSLGAELQLDRMKQKFWRRVFLQQSGQSSQVFPLELSRKASRTCQNITAYLRILVDVEISVSQLEEAGDNVTFRMQLRRNRDNPNSNEKLLHVPVKVEARMTLRGSSAPANILLPLITEYPKNESKKVADYGPQVEHIYRLQNNGPSSVSGAELLVNFPNRFRGSFLLYITKVTTEGSISCFPSNEINPLKLEVLEPTTIPSYNGTFQPQRWHEKRDVTSEADPAALQGPVVVNCSSQACAAILCQVGELEKGQGASVTIHAVLWLQSFQECPLEHFLIESQAWFGASEMPYRIQPKNLPSGTISAETLVERLDPDAEKSIPVWWIIAAVLAGLCLLAASIILLWKTGFFKRTRPPTDDKEELANDPQT